MHIRNDFFEGTLAKSWLNLSPVCETRPYNTILVLFSVDLPDKPFFTYKG